MAKANGLVLWEGPSRIDGAPIVVIATGMAKASRNDKTGNMVQTWILRADVDPVDAINTRKDASICGGCPHRGTSVKDRTCYVTVFRAPLMVWRAYKRGTYPRAADLAAPFAGRFVRLGSYGDPAAVPLEVWETVVSRAAGHTGYTHQWKSAKLRDVTSLCVASVDNVRELQKARALGLSTFRVRNATEALEPGEFVCPASEEAGKRTDCASCRACSGATRANVAIVAHGMFAGRLARKGLPVLQTA